MAEKDRPDSPINVRMGSNNHIGHIGHIIYQEPPPSPNAIRLNGRIIGEIGSAPTLLDTNTYVFPTLLLNEEMPIGSVFVVQGVRLRLDGFDVRGVVSMNGRPPTYSYSRAVCAVR